MLLHKVLVCPCCGHIGPTKVLRSKSGTKVFKVNISILYYLVVLSYVPHTLRFIFLKRLFLFPVILLNAPFVLKWRSSSTRLCCMSLRMSLMVASVVLMKLI